MKQPVFSEFWFPPCIRGDGEGSWADAAPLRRAEHLCLLPAPAIRAAHGDARPAQATCKTTQFTRKKKKEPSQVLALLVAEELKDVLQRSQNFRKQQAVKILFKAGCSSSPMIWGNLTHDFSMSGLGNTEILGLNLFPMW